MNEIMYLLNKKRYSCSLYKYCYFQNTNLEFLNQILIISLLFAERNKRKKKKK